MMIRSEYKQPSLLARLWLRLGAFLGKTLLWLVGLGLLGWLLATAWFAWQHSGPVSPDEQVPPGEAAMSQGIIQTAVRIVDQHREGTRYLRDAHAKAHGCVKAEVSVLKDLDPALRQGVFAEPGKTWQALMRLSNGNAYPQFDSIRDARGMAIKLLDVPGKQLMADQQTRTEQDFVMFSHPNFFVSDVAEYAQNIGAQADGKKVIAFFPHLDPRSWQVRHLFIALATLAPPGQPDADHLLFSFALQVWRGECQVPRGTRSAKLPGLCAAKAESGPAEFPAQRLESATVHRPSAGVFCVADSAAEPAEIHANRRHQYRMEGKRRAL